MIIAAFEGTTRTSSGAPTARMRLPGLAEVILFFFGCCCVGLLHAFLHSSCDHRRGRQDARTVAERLYYEGVVQELGRDCDLLYVCPSNSALAHLPYLVALDHATRWAPHPSRTSTCAGCSSGTCSARLVVPGALQSMMRTSSQGACFSGSLRGLSQALQPNGWRARPTVAGRFISP